MLLRWFYSNKSSQYCYIACFADLCRKKRGVYYGWNVCMFTGSMQRPGFASVMNSMKFIHGARAQAQAQPVLGELTVRLF